MRRSAPFALGLLLLSVSGCGGLISFDIDQSGTSTVPAQQAGLLSGLPGFQGFSSFNLSQSSQFANNNTNKDHITECRLTRLTLKVTNPPGTDLSFLSRIDFFISAPNLDKIHIAGIAPLPPGQSSVDLKLDDVDIAKYARSDSFSITTAVSGQSPKADTTIEADLKLNVHASIL